MRIPQVAGLPASTIEITIAPNGETKVEAKNFTGSSCRDATLPYETALGSPIKDTIKSEFWQETTTNHQEARNQ